MKVLVVGGAGYVGGPLVDKLLESEYDVRVYDDLSSGSREGTNGAHAWGEIRAADSAPDGFTEAATFAVPRTS